MSVGRRSSVGLKGFLQHYEKNALGFLAQGSEFNFGKMYARGINDETIDPLKDKWIQVV